MSSFQDTERRRKKAKSTYTDIKKHYVRLNGWLPVFNQYLKLRPDGIRYLTLCAKYAIDIRYFRLKGCLPYDAQQKIYPTVTFVEKDVQDYAIIAEGLGTARLGIRANLEDILVHPDSDPQAAEKLRGSFPYDIINLDFTGQVAREDDPPYSDTIRAIERIIELQGAADCRGWHMFLTFRACPQTSNHEADGELREIIEGNLENPGAQKAYGVRPPPAQLINQQYEEFIRIGVTKFIAGSSSTRGYACSLGSSFVYPRNPAGDDPPYHIVKLIVEFKAIRGARNLPNPHRARIAYETSVPVIFGSQAVDVSAELRSPQARQALKNDLKPVLDELASQHLIE